jgi:hypothetical protein
MQGMSGLEPRELQGSRFRYLNVAVVTFGGYMYAYYCRNNRTE